MKRIALLFLFLLPATFSFGQERFIVMISQSAYSIVSQEIKPLVTGRKLLPSDMIKIDSGGYVGLLHVMGKTLELTKPGVYSVDSLSNLFANLDYDKSIKAQAILHNAIMAEYPTYKTYGNTGTVECGPRDIINCPTKALVYPDVVYLKWKAFEKSSYEISLLNLYDDLLFDSALQTTSIKINLCNFRPDELEERAVKLKLDVYDGKKLIYTLDHYFITFAKDSVLQKTKTELEILHQALPEQSALNSFAIGLYFEKKNLLLNALYYYYEAAMSDYNLVYLKEYKKFLKRYEINKAE